MRRLYGLQYLRGVAALGVVAYHAADRAGYDFALGKAGVDLFFVLSGFLMWVITGEDSRPGPFLIDRIKRILPSYWIVTTVLLGGALVGLFPAIRLTPAHVAASYLFIPTISPSNGRVWPLLVPGWTLEYEMAFYLMFGLALFLPRRAQLAALTMLLPGLALLHPWIASGRTMARFYTHPHILEFLAGLWLAAGWRAGLPARQWGGPLFALAALLLPGIGLLAPRWPDVAIYGPPALLVVAGMLAIERRPDGVPDIAPLRLLGDSSYSIYLWHTLAISVTAKLAGRLSLAPVLAMPLHLVAGVGIGIVAYALIERPVMAAFRRPLYRHRVPVPGGV